MRVNFFKEIEHKSTTCNDIFVLTGDLGFKLFDDIAENCCGRYYDVGVAEPNMIGLAAGLALEGKKVYCYSIIPFIVMRAFEQIRIDVDYHNVDVKLIGVGGGFSYGFEGITHFGLEDYALMTPLINMTVIAPADQMEAKALAAQTLEHKGPMYIRLGQNNAPAVHSTPPDFEIGKAMFLEKGDKIALVANGSMVVTALQVQEKLKKQGINPTVVNMHSLKPFDRQAILEIAHTHEHIFTMEEHYLTGGLGSLTASVLAQSNLSCKFTPIGIDSYSFCVGDADYLRDQFGLSTEKVLQKILSARQ